MYVKNPTTTYVILFSQYWNANKQTNVYKISTLYRFNTPKNANIINGYNVIFVCFEKQKKFSVPVFDKQKLDVNNLFN